MAPPKLYQEPKSAASRGALLAARGISMPLEIVKVDLTKKEQLEESFLKINPQHCVPTLDDNGFILWQSRAIAGYLADKSGKDDQWYSRDLKKRALVNQRLYFDSSNLYVKIRAICYPILFLGETEIKTSLKVSLNNTLQFLDGFLSRSKWVAGDGPTIADTSICVTVTTILDCASLPGFEENQDGAKLFGEAVRKNLKQ